MTDTQGNEIPLDWSYQSMCEEETAAFKYLWARWNFCQRDNRLCWWFTFWDDFWQRNHEMEVVPVRCASLVVQIVLLFVELEAN